jgi:hypothetical protein
MLGGKAQTRPEGSIMSSLIYIIGLVVVIIAVLSLFGLT